EIGGWVADTPGIRQWELWGIEPGEVEAHFIEFRPFVPYCHFPDCTHTHETDCAVKEAVAAGLITAQRYHSYCRILQDFAESR
ncbi:MAG: ribosome small subunit-dependent GTPase A, partial [Planctomycetota bacterium]